jgi:hypothetical protein
MAKPPTQPSQPPTSPIQGQPGALPGRHDDNDNAAAPPLKPK